MYEITITGKSIPWKSPTVVQKPGKDGKIHRMAFSDKKLKAWQKEISTVANTYGFQPLEGPLELEIDIYLPRPKRCDSKAEIELWGTGRVPSATRPDRVNLVKAIEDGLNGILWLDDSQVWDCNARKWFHEQGGEPRVEIRVYKTEPVSPKVHITGGPLACTDPKPRIIP